MMKEVLPRPRKMEIETAGVQFLVKELVNGMELDHLEGMVDDDMDVATQMVLVGDMDDGMENVTVGVDVPVLGWGHQLVIVFFGAFEVSIWSFIFGRGFGIWRSFFISDFFSLFKI